MSVERELAAHSVEIDHLQKDVERIIDDIRDIKATLHAINDTLSQAKGGWRTLMLVGGAGAAVGVTASKFLAWLATLPAPK